MPAVYVLAVVLMCLANTGADDQPQYGRRVKRAATETCLRKGKPCRTVLLWKPKCCGDTVCYWTNGVSLKKKCQRDFQCCESLICHRKSFLRLDGKCGKKYGPNKLCFDHNSCLSGVCKRQVDKLWLEGKCK
ncbi:hypothetical protein LSH36_155g05016 [Paralvinella palmiformis]|uniref:Uncharacterized protein n=1 Tax=Paralvinella palmiformis TaxID=53620 RepID=A0AAD9JV69_9ANNE|nr:hypothetical protein LSH36_155g05016 [Paralvinella palmiformis]